MHATDGSNNGSQINEVSYFSKEYLTILPMGCHNSDEHELINSITVLYTPGSRKILSDIPEDGIKLKRKERKKNFYSESR